MQTKNYHFESSWQFEKRIERITATKSIVIILCIIIWDHRLISIPKKCEWRRRWKKKSISFIILFVESAQLARHNQLILLFWNFVTFIFSRTLLGYCRRILFYIFCALYFLDVYIFNVFLYLSISFFKEIAWVEVNWKSLTNTRIVLWFALTSCGNAIAYLVLIYLVCFEFIFWLVRSCISFEQYFILL